MPIEPNPIKTNIRLFNNGTLLDVLVEIEKLFDKFNLYAYENWFDGEVVAGPIIKRYWVSIILKYDYDQMPNPRGGAALTKHGIKVFFQKDEELRPVKIKSPDDYEDGTKRPKMKPCKVWLVTVKIPRRYIDEFEYDDLSQYDDEINLEDALSTDSEDIIKQQTQTDQGNDQSTLEDNLGQA